MRTARMLPALVLALLAVGAAREARAQRVYWIDTYYRSPALRSANADGTGLRTLALPVGSLPEGLAIDATTHQLYWGDGQWVGAQLHRALFDFTNTAALGGINGAIRGVAVDHAGGKLYWTTSHYGTKPAIMRSNIGGGANALLDSLPAGANPRGIALDVAHNKLYFADFDLGLIESCALDGSGLAALVNVGANAGPWGVAVDATAGFVYWTNYVAGTIERVSTSGLGRVTLRSGLGNPTYLALASTGGSLYWGEAKRGAQRIAHGSPFGGPDTTVAAPDSAYGGIAIDWTSLADAPAPDGVPTELALGPASPSPARAEVAFALALPAPAEVQLEVLDVQGRRVATLRDGFEPAGRQTIVWDGRRDGSRVPPGVYFARLRTGGQVLTRRLVIAR